MILTSLKLREGECEDGDENVNEFVGSYGKDQNSDKKEEWLRCEFVPSPSSSLECVGASVEEEEEDLVDTGEEEGSVELEKEAETEEKDSGGTPKDLESPKEIQLLCVPSTPKPFPVPSPFDMWCVDPKTGTSKIHRIQKQVRAYLKQNRLHSLLHFHKEPSFDVSEPWEKAKGALQTPNVHTRETSRDSLSDFSGFNALFNNQQEENFYFQ